MTPADSERGGIVFAITDVGEAESADNRGEKRARSSESVDAQGIVGAVAVGPFAVVDETGRYRIEIEIGQRV